MPGAFLQDVDEGSKCVERESSVQRTSEMLPPSAGTMAESVRPKRPESLLAFEYQGFPDRAEKQEASPCLHLSLRCCKGSHDTGSSFKPLRAFMLVLCLVPLFTPAPQHVTSAFGWAPPRPGFWKPYVQKIIIIAELIDCSLCSKCCSKCFICI